MTSKITPHQLTCEVMDNLLGLTIAHPRPAWTVESAERGQGLSTVLESGVIATEAESVQFACYEEGGTVSELTSGTFHFVASGLD